MMCDFDGLLAKASIYNNTIAHCVTPINIDTADIEIKYSYTNFKAGHGHEHLNFSWVYEPRVVKIFPDNGPLNGGTTVTIWGHDFIATRRLKCKFGELYTDTVNATIVNSTYLEVKFKFQC